MLSFCIADKTQICQERIRTVICARQDRGKMQQPMHAEVGELLIQRFLAPHLHPVVNDNIADLMCARVFTWCLNGQASKYTTQRSNSNAGRNISSSSGPKQKHCDWVDFGALKIKNMSTQHCKLCARMSCHSPE